MDRMQRARTLLIELEALKETDQQSSPIGLTRVLSLTLNDAEILAREILTELQLKEGLELKRAQRSRSAVLLPGVGQMLSVSARTLGLKRPAHKDVLLGRNVLR